MKSKEYNGWSSYETWVVNLWLDNECNLHSYWTDQSDRIAQKYPEKDEAITLLAEILENSHKESLPEVTGFAADLLNAAMSEVNWREIAAHLIDQSIEALA